MPSGHTASAAAFSLVVGKYSGQRIQLNALAAAVGFSRIYTGVHYPTDVVAGWLLGKGIGSLTVKAAPTAVRMLRAAARIRAQRFHRA